jgi:hypothetical protein
MCSSRLHGESSSLTSKIASGWIFAGSVISNVHMAACGRPRRFAISSALCAWSSSSMATAICLPSIFFGSAMKVCEGSGNGGW